MIVESVGKGTRSGVFKIECEFLKVIIGCYVQHHCIRLKKLQNNPDVLRLNICIASANDAKLPSFLLERLYSDEGRYIVYTCRRKIWWLDKLFRNAHAWHYADLSVLVCLYFREDVPHVVFRNAKCWKLWMNLEYSKLESKSFTGQQRIILCLNVFICTHRQFFNF